MDDRINLNVQDHVAEVVLDRPGKRNALDLRMFEALAATADTLAGDGTVRAVVLRGAGDHFCAGIDLELFSTASDGINPAMFAPQPGSPANLFQRAAYAWRELPVPVICVIQGIAWGGGMQIALGADLRYAAPDARLSIMEIRWGLVPDMAISATARGVVDVDVLKELAWTGRIVDAAEADRLGLVTAVHDDPLAAARSTAGEIAARSPEAVRAIKRLFEAGWQSPVAESLALEAALQGDILGKPNQLEAVEANLDKRQPRFADVGENGGGEPA